MSSSASSAQDMPISLETVTNWARSNCEWEKVYRYIFLHPKDFFAISPGRKWSIAHQVVFHGDVDLFKRILVLFSDNQINIRLKAADNKTILDVATEKRSAQPAMYTYVEHLFAQDQLIEEAKKNNWRSVMDILDKNQQLVNEKPPYSPCFLLHYVVQNGDAQVLQELLDKFQCLTNVLNANKENPLDMAIRLNKYDLCSILQPRTEVRQHFIATQPQSPPPPNLHRPDERSTFHSPMIPSTDPAKYLPPTSMPPPSPQPFISTAQPTRLGFGNIVVDIDPYGDFTVQPPGLINSVINQPPPQENQKARTGVQHVYPKKTIVSEQPLTNLDPPLPPPPKVSTSFNEQLTKNLTCTLTQEIFVDPVIANDGQTYERAAILDWVNVYHCSPTTGAPMDATFRDNTGIKQIIQSIRRQS